MTRSIGSGEPRFDREGTLRVLRDNIARADALITAAEHLIEEYPWGTLDDEDDEDEDESGDSISRRRNHLAHLIDSAKSAVRAAIYAGIELEAEAEAEAEPAKRSGAPRGR
jgi:hypothetical protein